MSYLNLPNLPGFSQAVISFWFRVPQESIDKAKAAKTNKDGAILDGIVPLVVMGSEGTGQTPSRTDKTEGVLTYEGGSGTECVGGLVSITTECTATKEIFPGVECCTKSLIIFNYSCDCHSVEQVPVHSGATYKTTATGPAPKSDPTFIGIDSDGTLYVNFESAKKPKVSNAAFDLSSITPGSARSGWLLGSCAGGDRAFGCDVLCCVCLLIECSNAAGEDNGEGYDHTTPSPPETPGTDPTSPENHWTEIPFALDETGAIYSNGIAVTADEWHHALISVDLRSVSSHGIGENEDFERPIGQYVDGTSLLYIALDDKNYNKDDLNSNWTEGKGPNDVITDGAWAIAGTAPDHDDAGIPHYSLNSSSVPSGAVGMPATSKYVNNVYRVEMAEFQMWTGKVLDTGNEHNRRAFIDYKRDANGKPVPDKDGKSSLQPAKPAAAEKLLGKPTVVLHGSGKWSKGDNTGSAGKLSPTGKIASYKPDPVLES